MKVPKVSDDIKPGDYVFACKFSDAGKNDPWRVDFVAWTEVDFAQRRSVHFKETGNIPFRYAKKITGRQGSLIIYHRIKKTLIRV